VGVGDVVGRVGVGDEDPLGEGMEVEVGVGETGGDDVAFGVGV
jgi:hypothetical protein